MLAFEEKLVQVGEWPLQASGIETLQVNVVEPFTVKVSPPFGEMTRAVPVMVKLAEALLTTGVSLSDTRTFAVEDAADAGIVQG